MRNLNNFQYTDTFDITRSPEKYIDGFKTEEENEEISEFEVCILVYANMLENNPKTICSSYNNRKTWQT